MNEPIIFIDGYAQVYRGFFAIRHLANSQGQPTNAVFGLAKFLFRLEKDYTSDLGAFVFDLGKPAFRMEIAPDYKANRPPMPDEMKSQLPYLRSWIKAAGWPILEYEGLEADDIIAGLAANFADYPVKVVSSDKDLAQMIDDRVQMLVPNSKGGGVSIRGREEVIAKFAVKPEQIIDYLSLIGDSSDNIPGVAGVGPKTAAKLINQFGSIDEMIGNIDKIENQKLKDKIAASAEILKKNQSLIKLKQDIPVTDWKNIEAIKRSKPDWEKLSEIANELELKSIIDDIANHKRASCVENDNLPLEDTISPEEPAPPTQKEASQAYTPDLFGNDE